jgi:hypothetical protein
MSLFQCARCGCRENTALSHQGFIFHDYFDRTGLEEYKGKKLCSACGPWTYKSGELMYRRGQAELPGVWHGQFERLYLPKEGIFTNRVGNLESKDSRPLSELYSTSEYPPVNMPRIAPLNVLKKLSDLLTEDEFRKYLDRLGVEFTEALQGYTL